MKIRLVIILLLMALLIAIGLGAAAWFMRPQVVETFPLNGASSIPITSQVRIEFSRPMDFESVISRLKIEPAVDGSYSEEGNSLIFTPSNTLPGGEALKVGLNSGARAASWLTFPMQGMSWTFTTSDLTLVYLWPSDGSADIYGLSPTSGSVIQFTQGMGVQEFSASSDGLVLYFSASNGKGGTDIYQYDRKALSISTSTANKPQRLMDCGTSQCRTPVVSPDGSYLAYELLNPSSEGGMGPASVRIMSLPDQSEVGMPGNADDTLQPAWSSRGWLAYYNRTSEMYELFDPETKENELLKNQTGQPGCWSPDGNFYLAPEIYYYPASTISETGTSHLLKYDVKDGTWTDLSVEIDVEDVEGIYSPDGGTIAFARKYLGEARWSFGRQLWTMKVDGSNSIPITDEANFNHYDLAWSRDGRKLAYVRFDQVKLSDPPELWMINADGSEPIQLVIGGFSPIWIP